MRLISNDIDKRFQKSIDNYTRNTRKDSEILKKDSIKFRKM